MRQQVAKHFKPENVQARGSKRQNISCRKIHANDVTSTESKQTIERKLHPAEEENKQNETIK